MPFPPPPPVAPAALQRQVWRAVVRRFEVCSVQDGLTQADLGRALGVPRGQVSVWLKRPEHMTLKAAARLLDAMDADLRCELVVRPEPKDDDR